MPLTKAQVVTSLSTHDMLSNRRYFEWSEGGSRDSECENHTESFNSKGVYRVPTKPIAMPIYRAQQAGSKSRNCGITRNL